MLAKYLTILLLSSTSILLPITTCTDQSPCPSRVKHATYEWEALWIHWAGLHQELVPPAIQCVKALGVIDIVYQHAAIGASVEGNT